MIGSYKEQIDILQTQVIIDGDLAQQQISDISELVSKTYNKKTHKSQFQPVEGGDRYYKIVNLADTIAYQLRNLYLNLAEGKKGPYDERRVQFNLMQRPKKEGNKYVNRRLS